MKKISMIIFALVVATNASTFSELEKRVADLEQQVTKLTIKLLDREMAKESPVLNMAVDTTTSISGLIDSTLIESDEDEGEDEYIEVDEETYYKRQRFCVDYCTEQFNKSWNQSVEAAHQCMDECMRF
jgi:hypothetical protein